VSVYEFGRPYRVVRRDRIPEATEMVHGERYELVYDFESERPLSLHQARTLYYNILASPAVKEGTKVRYFKVEQFSTKGRMYLQFESAHPLPIAAIASAVVAACLVAAAAAFIVFVVPPALAAGYKLTTAVLALPNYVAIGLGLLVFGAGAYLVYRWIRGGRK